MTPSLFKLFIDQRNIRNYTESQSLKAETWSKAEILIPVDSMQNSVLWDGVVWGLGVWRKKLGRFSRIGAYKLQGI